MQLKHSRKTRLFVTWPLRRSSKRILAWPASVRFHPLAGVELFDYAVEHALIRLLRASECLLAGLDGSRLIAGPGFSRAHETYKIPAKKSDQLRPHSLTLGRVSQEQAKAEMKKDEDKDEEMREEEGKAAARAKYTAAAARNETVAEAKD